MEDRTGTQDTVTVCVQLWVRGTWSKLGMLNWRGGEREFLTTRVSGRLVWV